MTTIERKQSPPSLPKRPIPSIFYKLTSLIFEYFLQLSQLCPGGSLEKEIAKPQRSSCQWNCDLKPTQQRCLGEPPTILIVHYLRAEKSLQDY